jgi:hypothetical protein
MDKDRQVTLHRRKAGQDDRMTTGGRAEDIIRQFKALPKSKRDEYSIVDGSMEYGPHEIDNLARQLGLDEDDD